MSAEAVRARLPPHLARWAVELHSAAACYRLCPYLLAAVVERESRGGLALTPPSPDGTGDKGHGRGLAQVDDRFHPGFITATDGGGRRLWQQPAWNLLYGAMLLRQALDALGDMHFALAAYNAGVSRVRKAVNNAVLPEAVAGPTLEQRRAAADRCTTGGDYARDVLRRRAQWAPPDAPLTPPASPRAPGA